MNLLKSSFNQISTAIRHKEVSAAEVTKFFLDRIEKYNAELNAFITLNDNAIDEAKKIDEKISKKEEVGKLCGLPWGIKDMLCTKGMRTTAASKMLSQFIPPYDSTVVKKLKNQDAIILGKLNQDEFAMGSSNETSFYGTTRNPWNTQYTTGGSSGGSAAAQAARLCAGSIGTDTGGSIRQPANFCGVFGIKPTYSRVSRYGVVSYASSLDQVGPLSSFVEDAALALEVICGHDDFDSTSSREKVPSFVSQLNENMKGKKIGIINEYELSNVDSDIQKEFSKAIDFFKKNGAEIIPISISASKYAVPIYYLISASEASSNLSRYDGVKFGYRSEFNNLASVSLDEFYTKTRGEGFGSEVKRRILLGTYFLSSGYIDAYYKKACQVRSILKEQFLENFKNCDLIISPTTTTPAFKIGEKSSDPLKMYLNDVFTVSVNLAGLPAASVPFGLSADGLPIGLQIIGKHFDEQTILNAAYFIEKNNLKNWAPDYV